MISYILCTYNSPHLTMSRVPYATFGVPHVNVECYCTIMQRCKCALRDKLPLRVCVPTRVGVSEPLTEISPRKFTFSTCEISRSQHCDYINFVHTRRNRKFVSILRKNFRPVFLSQFLFVRYLIRKIVRLKNSK